MRRLNTSSSDWRSWNEIITVVEIAVVSLALFIIGVELLFILSLLYR